MTYYTIQQKSATKEEWGSVPMVALSSKSRSSINIISYNFALGIYGWRSVEKATEACRQVAENNPHIRYRVVKVTYNEFKTEVVSSMQYE